MNVSTRTIVSATVILGVLGLYSWHRSLPDLPADNSEVAPNQQFKSIMHIASPSPGDMLSTPELPAVSPGTKDLSVAEWRSINSQIAEADRSFVNSPSTPGIYKAFNRSRNLAFTVSADAVEVRPRTSVPVPDGQDSAADPDWFVRLGLPQSDGTTIPENPEANRIEIMRDGVLEWYVHRENGLEQGFTLERPPAGQPLDAVTIDLPIETSLSPRQVAGSGTIRFVDASGQTAMSYEKLQAFDADGQELPAEMRLVSADDTASQSSIRLVVDTTHATYPVVIDPLLTTHQPLTIQEDTANLADGPTGDVKLDGDTLAVGEPYYDPTGSNPVGWVKIFYRQTDGSWLLVKTILSGAGADSYNFGGYVDLDGDVLIVDEGKGHGGNTTEKGAFIFARNQGGADNWGEVTELSPEPFGHGFGVPNGIAVRGDWAFVAHVGWTDEVRIYHRTQGGANNWGEIQRITEIIPSSMAVSPNGEFLLAGAPGSGVPISSGAAHLYAVEAGVFVHVAELPPPNPTLERFGATVAISDTSFAVRASSDSNGAVYVYEYGRTYDSQLGAYIYSISAPQEILPPEEVPCENFGRSLGFNSTYLCIGQHGDANLDPFFFYQRDPGNQQWILSRIMVNSQAPLSSRFGYAFDLTETHLAVATEEAYPSMIAEVDIYALDGHAGDQLGSSVCVEGDTAVVGATQADGLAANSGAAYVFNRPASSLEPWGLQRKIMANDGASDDLFGFSASLSGDIVVIGAPQDDDHGLSSGAAYAFSRDAGGASAWGQVQKFAPADTAAGDYFGYSVGIWINRVVIGAPYHDAFDLDEGTAYLYESGAFKTKFDGFIAGRGDQFGFSVGIDGDFLIVGAPYNDWNAGVSNAGTAIVFKRDPATGNWPEFSTLIHTSPGTDDRFGWSVSTYGGHAMVGAPFRDEGGVADSGTAYLYLDVGPLTSPVDKTLVPHDPGAGNQFGRALALRGTRAVVGASGSGVGPSVYPGAVYVFDQGQGGAGKWGQATKRMDPDGKALDLFGYAVAIDGDTIVVGAPWYDCPLMDSGAAYYYGVDDLYEENDTLATAHDLSGNAGAFLSTINGPGIQADDDWYEIDVPAGQQRVLVECRFTHAEGDIDIQLIDASGTFLASASSTDDDEFIDFRVPVAGPYYVRASYGNTGNTYDLMWNALPDDCYEENDDLGTAYDLSGLSGVFLSSFLGQGVQADDDWFEISVPAGSLRVEIECQFTHGTDDIDIRLTDLSGTTMSVSASTSDDELIDFTVPVAGIYCIKVYTYGTPAGRTYDLMWSVQSDDSYEENDILTAAYDLSGFHAGALSTIHGFGVQADDDWYRIDVTPDFGRILVECLFTHAEGDIDIELTDSSGGVLDQALSIDDNEMIDYPVSAAGTYNIRVFLANVGNTYDLHWEVADNYEQNDTLATAYDLSGNAGALLSTLNGLGIQDDYDWYEIYVPVARKRVQVECQFVHANGDIDIRLIGPTGTTEGFSNSTDDNELIDFTVPAPGTYYVWVYGSGTGTGNGNTYDLVWDALPSDVDGDGLTWDQEDTLGTSDNDRDSDDDGFEDGVEYYCMGTDPADPNSGPFHLSIEVTPPSATLTWNSQSGIIYVIDQRADLSTGSWTEVPGSQITATVSPTSRVITLNPPSATEIFYRVRIPSCSVPPP